jgi:hypothetical protein
MDWINIDQNSDKWHVLVNQVMHLWVSQMQGISWQTEKLSAVEEVLCSMELASGFHCGDFSHLGL